MDAYTKARLAVLDEISEFASQSEAKRLKSKYGPKPAAKPTTEPEVHPLDDIDEATLAKLTE